MKEQEVLQVLRECIANIDVTRVREACEQALSEGVSPLKAINDGMLRGMQVVGDKFQAGEYFLTELIAAGAAMEEGLRILEPHLKKDEARTIGSVVLGTVEGDLHSIGKDIVGMLLRAAGFRVVDLGVDVPTGRFVESVQSQKPRILGMSALITPTMPEMQNVVGGLENAGLRGQLKVIVGGAPLSKKYAETIGADAYAPDAVAGVSICKEWVGQGNSP